MDRTMQQQISTQFLEADIECAFALVDEAKAYRMLEQPAFRSRVLLEANSIVADVERRLGRLAGADALPFYPLVQELHHEIAEAEREDA